MKHVIKSYLKKTIIALSNLRFFRLVFYEITGAVINYVAKVNCRGQEIKFYTPNSLTFFRMSSIETKEPETLDWIDSFDKNSCFFDVGANIGVFSLYAAKARSCKVFSFEPSVFNLEFLAKNINVNNLVEQVTLIPAPLYSKSQISYMSVSSMEWGGAFVGTSQDRVESEEFGFYTSSLSLNRFTEAYNIPQPDYVKIDVDGVENLILQGGDRILSKLIVAINQNKSKSQQLWSD